MARYVYRNPYGNNNDKTNLRDGTKKFKRTLKWNTKKKMLK